MATGIAPVGQRRDSGSGGHHVGWSAASLRETPLTWRTGRGMRVRHWRWPASGRRALGQVSWRREPAKGRVQHEAAAHDRWQAARSTMATEGARVDASAHGVPASGRDAVQRNANAIAPGRTMLRCCKLTAAVYRLNLRPGRARRLSKAGRHWAPIARQRATRKERHSGRTGPTYCNKPNSEPPVIDGMERTVARGDSRCKAENVFSCGRFSQRLPTRGIQQGHFGGKPVGSQAYVREARGLASRRRAIRCEPSR